MLGIKLKKMNGVTILKKILFLSEVKSQKKFYKIKKYAII